MQKKIGSLYAAFIVLTLLVPFSFTFINTTAQNSASTPANVASVESFKLTSYIPTWIDSEGDAVADSFQQEFTENLVVAPQSQVSVTVVLKTAPTTQDVASFIACGGRITTSLWTEAIYGFGGTITYMGLSAFTRLCPNLLLVEKEAIGFSAVAYAARQVGARTYVWNTLGLQGDPNTSIAIVDTGIDASHSDFAPGYGDQDFSQKIVGWYDPTENSSTPIDSHGHGSHVSGLAAGDGFFSVDKSGSATAIFSTSYETTVDRALSTGFMVNNTGNIVANMIWHSTGNVSVSSITLQYVGKSTTNSPIITRYTPQNDTWYTVNYEVDSLPTGGYDMYRVMVNVTGGKGTLYFAVNMSWPYMPPTDSFAAWTGIAPQSKLVGVKVFNASGYGTDKDLIEGIEWIIKNRATYHITVASMSLGFDEDAVAVNQAVRNLVNSGITTVVAAGNSGPGTNGIYTPGSVDEIISVAALNQFDNLAIYSSQGGQSTYTGQTIKPDIAAPGGSGSFVGVPLYSANSETNDAILEFGGFQTADDAAPMQGTSMATPIIAGCAQLVIQAMGGYENWNYTKTQALQPKMLLLMTASETYPNIRERTLSWGPTLERGGKDRQEGYGRVNVDAAVDAVLKSYTVGTTVSGFLGEPPTMQDISVVGQNLVWARNLQLNYGYTYNFSLNVPAGADYDIYLYNNTGNMYGEPSIVARSAHYKIGGTENFTVTAPYSGTYYLVVKRATAVTGSGAFTVSSLCTANANITITTPGLLNASNAVHYTFNGISQVGSIVNSQFSAYADVDTTISVDSTIYASNSTKYVATQPYNYTVQPTQNITLNVITEYHSIESAHPYSNNVIDAWQLTRQNASAIRLHFRQIELEDGWDYLVIIDETGNMVAEYSGNWTDVWTDWFPTNHLTLVLISDQSITYSGFAMDILEWQKPTGTPLTDKQTIDLPYDTYFYLQVNSTNAAATGQGWYKNGTTAYPQVAAQTINFGNETRLQFAGWTGETASSQATVPIYMDSPKTVTANWQTQYRLTFTTYPLDAGTTSPSGSNLWVNSGQIPLTATNITGYRFMHWTTTNAATQFSNPSSASTTAIVNGPATICANYALQPSPTPNQTAPLSQPTPTLTPTATPTQPPNPAQTNTETTPENTSTTSPTVPELTSTSLLIAAFVVSLISVAVIQKQRQT